MLGDFIYSGEVDNAAYEYESPYKSATPVKFEKAIKRFLLLAVVFVCGGLIWIFGISPCMVPAKIDVQGFSGFGKAEALQFAGIDSGATYISINAAGLERQLAGHHLVESAKVVKRFPDRLSVFLEPRRAVAIVLARVNDRIQPVYFDRYGVAVKIGNGTGELTSSLMPVVSGVLDEAQVMGLGMRLSAAYLPLFLRIGAISEEDPRIWQAISEIGIAKKSNDLFDLILYPVQDSIKLRMRSDISKESIYYALLMYDVCRKMGDNPEEIDARSGLGVVKAKEGSFGK
jgi:cell division septal protein FtsQ